MSARRAHGEASALAPLLLGAMVGSFVAGRTAIAVLCVVIAGVAAARAGAPRPSRLWLRVVALGAAIALTLNLYLTPGRALPLPAIAGAHASAEGLRLGVLLALRLIGATLAVHGLRAVWPGERAADELARILAPLQRVRAPVAELRVVLGLALRFAPLLAVEAQRIAAVQDLRAGRPPRGVLERLARRRAVVIPALVNALERAERVALALEARHYRVRPLPPAPRLAWGWSTAGVALAGAALFLR